MNICNTRTCKVEKEVYTRELIINYRCDYSCDDCYIPIANLREMSIEVVKEVIEDAFLQAGIINCKRVEFVICGGEVLLTFPLLKEIVLYIRSKIRRLPYSISIETKGTIINDDILSWIQLNSSIIRIKLILQKEWIHNVDFTMMDKISSKLMVYLVLNAQDTAELYELVIYLHNLGYEPQLRYQIRKPWEAKDIQIYLNQALQLLEFYKHNPKIKPVNIFDIDSMEILSQQWDSPYCRCPAGSLQDAVDVNAKRYYCRKLSPLYLIGSAVRELMEETTQRMLEENQGKCNKCIYRVICNRCPGDSYYLGRKLSEVPNILCILIKINLKLTCKYCISLLSQEDLNLQDKKRIRDYTFAVIDLLEKN